MSDDPQDTQVLKQKDTPISLEGTAEMDRPTLLARLQADAQRRNEPQPPRESAEVVSANRDTEQHAAITERTRPSEPHLHAKNLPTQHYVVPDSLLEQANNTSTRSTLEVALEPLDDDVDDYPTTTFSMDAILEFEAVVDAHGRIALPDSALQGRFGRGARLKIVAHVVDHLDD